MTASKTGRRRRTNRDLRPRKDPDEIRDEEEDTFSKGHRPVPTLTYWQRGQMTQRLYVSNVLWHREMTIDKDLQKKIRSAELRSKTEADLRYAYPVKVWFAKVEPDNWRIRCSHSKGLFEDPIETVVEKLVIAPLRLRRPGRRLDWLDLLKHALKVPGPVLAAAVEQRRGKPAEIIVDPYSGGRKVKILRRKTKKSRKTKEST